jgi:transposase
MRAEKADGALARMCSSQTIARLMTVARDARSNAETIAAAVESGVPPLVDAREIIAAFQTMIQQNSPFDFDLWPERVKSGLAASFANGVIREQAAVSAAITMPWSKAQTERQFTKLKFVKRHIYGRGKLDLLQARVIGFASC